MYKSKSLPEEQSSRPATKPSRPSSPMVHLTTVDLVTFSPMCNISPIKRRESHWSLSDQFGSKPGGVSAAGVQLYSYLCGGCISFFSLCFYPSLMLLTDTCIWIVHCLCWVDTLTVYSLQCRVVNDESVKCVCSCWGFLQRQLCDSWTVGWLNMLDAQSHTLFVSRRSVPLPTSCCTKGGSRKWPASCPRAALWRRSAVHPHCPVTCYWDR